MIINHNMAAMNTHRQLGSNNAAAANNIEKLSSGLKINKAGDDAAGLAISEKMRGQIRGLDMASKNAQDSISLIQTAEGALNETHDILQRMRELAVQSSNDTNTQTDRGEIQKEVDQLAEEISRIGNNTEFNTKNLLDGSFGGKFHIGANSDQNVDLKVSDMRANSLEIVGNANQTFTETSAYAGASTGGGGGAEVANSITEGEYTVKSAASGFSLVDKHGNEVATSSDGETFNGLGEDPGGTTANETLTFTGALAAGDKVSISGNDATVDKQITGSKLEAGEFTLKGNDLVASNGKVVATSTDSTVFKNEKQETVFTAAAAMQAGDMVKVGGINVSDQDSANKAVTTLQTSIDKVSAERSKLGAMQNRLDHTINNLGTSSENLTAAESRIRDVDYVLAA